MKNNFAKKIMAVTLALSMIFGTANIVSAAHAANGTNITASMEWDSFSVRDDLHNGGVKNEWALALDEEIAKTKDDALADYMAGKITADEYDEIIAKAETFQSYTEGYFTAKPTSDGFTYFAVNTGWDGEYHNGNLVADNPWGMTVQSKAGVPVELGRKYTVSFKIRSTLRTAKKDAEGNTVKDAEGNTVWVTTKHIGFKAYDIGAKGGPAVSFDSITGGTTDGIIALEYDSDDQPEDKKKWQTVTAQITIPYDYESGYLGAMFSMGARQVAYPDELAMSGYVYVKDFQVIAGDQFKVTYKGNGKSYSSYVNKGSKTSATSAVIKTIGKKNYTIDYYTLNGSKYNFNTGVTKDITLAAHYTKTKKPVKATITAGNTKTKKKVKLTFKKIANTTGYQVRYSYKKNMKKAKKTTSKKTTCTLKSLKSGAFVYVQARAYNTDSLGNLLYGKWSKKKSYVVR